MAYRRPDQLAWVALHEAALPLHTEDAREQLVQATEDPTQGRHDFNLSLMVFLPEKRAGVDPSLGDCCDSLGSKAALDCQHSRILATAARIRFGHVLDVFHNALRAT